MTPQEQRTVLDLLDVRVTIVSWRACKACDGRGKTKGGTGGLPCRSCRAMRRIPTFRIEGVVLDTLEVGAPRPAGALPDSAIPFRLELVAV